MAKKTKRKLSWEEKEMLNALGWMWNQYCGKNGHLCMSAGESAAEVLMKYGLLRDEWSRIPPNKLDRLDKDYSVKLKRFVHLDEYGKEK